ncbi:MAG: CHAT domain-containing protein [Anaerolineae bacterium]|nr:CHAT domain-containing protein [Anaerolineae bacterium]
MSGELKVTFQMTIREGQRLETHVTAPGGETTGETSLPPKDALDELALADPARLSAVLVERVGEALYRTLVCEAVDELVLDTLTDALRAGRPAQFELRFAPDQIALAGYPWEMIRNAQGQFLVRDGLIDLTRYITYPQPPPTFDKSIQGLPLFRLISQPSSLPPITSIDLKFKPQETLAHATFEGFTRRLLIDRLALWGLQFDGHGTLAFQCLKCDSLNGPNALTCRNCGESLAGARHIGALAFEKEGDVHWIPTGEFGSVLYNAHVQLAMLLACETSRVGNTLVFSGLAPGLLLAGVPAVIGMQFPVRDDFANGFANEFYAALSQNNDVLAALRIARRMNVLGAWYSPTLYLRHKPDVDEQKVGTTYLRRNIDTAAPARVQPGVDFLARLWIRRPETKPLSASRLRQELDISKEIPVCRNKGEAEVKFEPVEGRKLRRGEVEVQMTSPTCDVKPEERIKLFIDESLDAPPAIFTARARQSGRVPLIFNVWQDGGQIHTVVHHIEVSDAMTTAIDEIATHSQPVDVDDREIVRLRGDGGKPGHGAQQKPVIAEKTDEDGAVFWPKPRIAPLGETRLVAEDGRAFQIVSGENRVGRSPDNHIYLSGDQTVSRWHAVIVKQEDGSILQDLGSTGGTYVNGERITTMLLQDGDEIQFGQDTRLRFYVEETKVMPSTSSPLDMEDTLHHIPERIVDKPAEMLEEPDADYEGWQEEISQLKEVMNLMEPELSAGTNPADEAPTPSESMATSELKAEQKKEENVQHQGDQDKKHKREIEDEQDLTRPSQKYWSQVPPKDVPTQIPSPHGDTETSLPTDKQTESAIQGNRLPFIAGGCIVVAIMMGLLLVGVILISKGCSSPATPPTVMPDIREREDVVAPGDTAPPIIEAVEHVPGEVGYGEYCPEEENQFTIQAHAQDDTNLVSVMLVYTFYTSSGEQVGAERTVDMFEIRSGLYAVTVPTSVAQEVGYTAAVGEIRYTVIASDESGNQSSSGQPRVIPIHQCLG